MRLSLQSKAGNVADLIAILGSEGKDLIESSDPATARHNRKVFTVAVGEQWHLEDAAPDRKTLVIGNENWPFPVPLVNEQGRWRFDTAAGKEEVIARRIGRNELAAIATVRAYVTAQRRYAEKAHDGNPAGVTPRNLRAIRARRTACTGPRPPARNEVRSGIWSRRRRQKAAASMAIARTVTVPWLLLQDPDRARTCRSGRSEAVRGQRPDVRRVCAGRLAGSV